MAALIYIVNLAVITLFFYLAIWGLRKRHQPLALYACVLVASLSFGIETLNGSIWYLVSSYLGSIQGQSLGPGYDFIVMAFVAILIFSSAMAAITVAILTLRRMLSLPVRVSIFIFVLMASAFIYGYVFFFIFLN